MAINLLLRGDHLIDPKNAVDALMDLAVDRDIPVDRATRVVEVK